MALIWPRSHILASMAPSMQAGMLSSICSEAAMKAILGVAMPKLRATPVTKPAIFTFWRKSGAGITAMSVMKMSLW